MKVNWSWTCSRTSIQPVSLHQLTLLPTTTTPNDSSTCIFHALDDKAIRQAALRTQGSAGPSGVDAIAWKRWCMSYGRASVGLCKALAAVGRRICMGFVDPSVLMAFNACRLIPLDKNPGVRPIGVVEVCRRIIGKAVMGIVKLDLIEATFTQQRFIVFYRFYYNVFHSFCCVYTVT